MSEPRDREQRPVFHVEPTRATVHREIDDEVQFHLQTRIEELVRSGRSRADAEEVARREFGDVSAARDELAAIDKRRLGKTAAVEWWASFVHDLELAARALRTRPVFSATILLTLALGIGANAAIFSVVDAVLLRALPFSNTEQLVYALETYNDSPKNQSEASWPDFLDWRARNHTFGALAGYQTNRVLIGGDHPTLLIGAQVTSNLLDVLGVSPAVGRRFVDGEDAVGAPKVAILSDAVWKRDFAGDLKIVGRQVQMEGAPATIVGVLPPDFHMSEDPTDVLVPITRTEKVRQQRGNHWIHVIGRLRDGATIAAARSDLTAIMNDLAAQYPIPNAKRGVSLTPMRDHLVGSVRPLVLLLYGAVLVLLVVSCSNVANLLLMRGADREREIAVRAALGAGRGRLVRQLLTELLLLGVIGGVAGLGLARVGVQTLVSAMPRARVAAISGLASASVDARVVLYTLLVSIIAVVAAGLVPALRATRPSLYTALRQGGRNASRGTSALRDGLVVAEIALTVVLVSGAALFGRSLVNLLSVESGFRTDHLLTAGVLIPDAGYTTPQSRVDFFRRVVDRLRESPQVEAAGLTTKLPFDYGNTISYHVIGHPALKPGEYPEASFRQANPEYLRALGVPLEGGRWFTDADDGTAPHVVVINHTLAAQEFRGENPIGRYFEHAIWDDSMRIVGVVGDVVIGKQEDPIPPTIYLPFAQLPQTGMRMAIRVQGDVTPVVATLRQAVRAVDPQAVVNQPMSMDAYIEATPSVFIRRFPLLLVGTFAGATLVLALVGVYGVVSYSVSQRMREMGIRMALGARASNLLALVLWHGLVIAGGGAAIGIIVSMVLGRFMAGMLYGVGARDPVTLAGSAVLLAVAAVAATIIPARRATRVDPAVALQAE
jgi:predicted permease